MSRRITVNRGFREPGTSSFVPPQTPLPHIYRYGDKGGRPAVADLLTAAQQLSAEQRKELLDRLALASQSTRSRNDREVVMWAQALYEAIVDAFGSDAGVGGPALVQRQVATAAAWRPVEEFMQTSGMKDCNVREQQAVYRLLARLLVDRARDVAARSRIPFSLKLTINCLGELRGVFEAAFPGYLRNGLASLIVRRMASGETATAA